MSPKTPLSIATARVQAASFFNHWAEACAKRLPALLKDWSNGPLFTSLIFSEPDAIIETVAKDLDLQCYCGYYCLDAILFGKDGLDLVPDCPAGTTWVRRIRVAFEHENFFNSGLFQEVSHLLITDCDLRVLVSYPDNEGNLNYQLKYLHTIVSGSDRSTQISETSSLLFIVGGHDVAKRQLSGGVTFIGMTTGQKH